MLPEKFADKCSRIGVWGRAWMLSETSCKLILLLLPRLRVSCRTVGRRKVAEVKDKRFVSVDRFPE